MSRRSLEEPEPEKGMTEANEETVKTIGSMMASRVTSGTVRSGTATRGMQSTPQVTPQGTSAVAASSGRATSGFLNQTAALTAYDPPPSIALRVFNPEGNVEMELTLDHPSEDQVDAIIDIFRNTRRMQ